LAYDRKSGLNKTFLKQEGCELGLTICMTKNANMTEEAWEKMTPSIFKGEPGVAGCER
jgi:hypothetical protein